MPNDAIHHTNALVLPKFKRRTLVRPVQGAQRAVRQAEAHDLSNDVPKADTTGKNNLGPEPIPQSVAAEDIATLPRVEVAEVNGDAARPASNEESRPPSIQTTPNEPDFPIQPDLVAEWVRYAEAKASVFGQPVHKPQGGRPEGGVSRAARELPVPGKTFGARRKFIVRAVDIGAISDDAKAAARAAVLDDIQSALLAIAGEKSPDKQLAKVKELGDRKALPRRKGKAADNKHDATAETNARTTGASDSGSSIKPEIDESEAVSKLEPDQSKPASAVEDVKEFNRLQNRVRLVLGKGLEHSSSESESNRGSSPASSQLDLFKPEDEGAAIR